MISTEAKKQMYKYYPVYNFIGEKHERSISERCYEGIEVSEERG